MPLKVHLTDNPKLCRTFATSVAAEKTHKEGKMLAKHIVIARNELHLTVQAMTHCFRTTVDVTTGTLLSCQCVQVFDIQHSPSLFK